MENKPRYRHELKYEISYFDYLILRSRLKASARITKDECQKILDGTIPSTSDAQKNSSALIDASEIDTSVMGSMHNNDKGMGEGFKNRQNTEGEDDQRPMRPGGMAPQKDGTETQNGNWITVLLSGIAMAAAPVFSVLFKRRKVHI